MHEPRGRNVADYRSSVFVSDPQRSSSYVRTAHYLAAQNAIA
jgi:hypothetical protein